MIYKPKRVFVSPSASEYPRTYKILERIKHRNPKIEIIYLKNQTPVIPFLSPKERYNYIKESLVLCTRSAYFMEVFASPGHSTENLGIMGKLHSNCPLKCNFCYLDVSGRSTPWVRIYVDLENFYDQSVKERLVYKIVQGLWSAASFSQGVSFDKVPPMFKSICDSKIRKAVLSKRNPINSEASAVWYLKNNLRNFLSEMGIKVTLKEVRELKRKVPEYFAENSKYPLSINISEYSDVIALDHITNIMEELLQLVNSDPDFRIRFRTKSANIDNLLKYEGNNQVQVTFSINTPHIIEKYERGASSVDQMITAIKSLQSKGGYKIQIAIEPIIKYEGYEQDYRTLIQRLKEEIDLTKVSDLKIGTVRYKTRLKNFILKTYPRSGLLLKTQGLVEPEKGDKRWRYSKEERMNIYSVLKNELSGISGLKLGLGSENPELWDLLGLNRTEIHTDVVYQNTTTNNNGN